MNEPRPVSNGNAQWKISFWVMSVIVGTFFTALTANVIANDRLRSSEDQRIENKFDTKFERSIHEQHKVNTEILLSLQDIKTRMGITNRMT